MKPRLFAGRGELPLAESKAVLFSGRPDRAGTLDTIADMTLDEKCGGRQREHSENTWTTSRLRKASPPKASLKTAVADLEIRLTVRFVNTTVGTVLANAGATVAAVVALVNLLP